MNLSERVQASNTEFSARGLRVRLELRGQSLYLRRMLPPKPNSSAVRPSQQRIATGLRGEAGLRVAKKRAELLDAECDTNRFRWENWGWEPLQEPLKKVGDWVQAFEAQWRAKGNRAEVTWNRDYWEVFKRLPQQALLTDTIILDRIHATNPRTKTRSQLHGTGVFNQIRGH
ncbi:MAG: hypothetical protein AAFY57_14230 [Cyanobacteria bacterium J06642_2]